MKKILIHILASPLLIILVLFDVVKIPILVIFTPLWALMATIAWLKGEEFLLWEFLWDLSTIGLQMYKEIVA